MPTLTIREVLSGLNGTEKTKEAANMGIRIEEKIITYDSITCEAIDPSYLGIRKEEIEKYLPFFNFFQNIVKIY